MLGWVTADPFTTDVFITFTVNGGPAIHAGIAVSTEKDARVLDRRPTAALLRGGTVSRGGTGYFRQWQVLGPGMRFTPVTVRAKLPGSAIW